MPTQDFEAPRFAECGPLLIAGLAETYNDATSTAIPALWQCFVPHIGHMPGQQGGVTYGVIYHNDGVGNWQYLCGVEVAHSFGQSAEFSRVTLPKQKYAVFSHHGHLATLRRTWHQIWNQWFPQSGLRVLPTPKFERYSETFEPAGTGGVELWIPVEK